MLTLLQVQGLKLSTEFLFVHIYKSYVLKKCSHDGIIINWKDKIFNVKLSISCSQQLRVNKEYCGFLSFHISDL